MRIEITHAVAIYMCVAASILCGCTARKGQAVPGEATVSTSGESSDTAALQGELDKSNLEVDSLKAEIGRLVGREDDLTQQLKQALRSSPGKTISDQPGHTGAAPAPAATIKQLQDELRTERQKRQKLEQQLARLEKETSSPPIPVVAAAPTSKEPAEPVVPAPALLSSRPIAETDLPPVPAPAPPVSAPSMSAPSVSAPAVVEAPPRPHDLLRALPVPTGDSPAEITALQTRGIEQEARQQEAMANLARVLDADRRRQEDLEAQIVALRSGAPGTEGAVSGDSNEVRHLRTRLEEERRRNAELTAKLKLAGRVTDLVFRMQNQVAPLSGSAPAPGSPPAPAQRFPQVSQEDVNPSAPNQPYIQDGEVHQPTDPHVPQVRPRDLNNTDQPQVPQVDQPPVFPDGPVETEETTQD